VKAVAVGGLAQAALIRTGGRARVLARLGASVYLTAGDDIVWLGPAGATLHPRAILAATAPDPRAAEIEVGVAGLAPWQPALPALDARTTAVLLDGWRRLAAALGALGAPGGFGALLAGRPPGFPLQGAEAAARALAAACARDDAAAAGDAALTLLGLGGGLTPSGDDYAGGALFARHLLAMAGRADAPAWRRTARAVLAAAPARTHPISAALLGDLAAGLGWAPLHDLVAALAGEAPADALEAARRLVRLGHTSGWDLLAGLGAGLGTLGGIARA
jgi:hypothetical protein